MSNRSSVLVRHVTFISFLLIQILQPVSAQILDEKRDQAKEAYFSGDLEASLLLFQPLSKSGDAESQYYIGIIYLTKTGQVKIKKKHLLT